MPNLFNKINPYNWFPKSNIEGPQSNMEGLVTRRGALKALAIGLVLAPLVKINTLTRKKENRSLLRPPFARINDDEFMDLCIRCGMCMAVCPSNTLQPAYLEAGAEGLMTPILQPEIAGCIGGCNACGDVCPTNAIFPFSKEEKFTMKQGTAKLELDRCIGYTENAECNACVKVCPTLAIKVLVLDGVPKPVSIEPSQCIGCALCEEECNKIISNDSACVTTNKGRGLPTDMAAIEKLIKERQLNGKNYLPKPV